jgi:subtilisin family serine protease
MRNLIWASLISLSVGSLLLSVGLPSLFPSPSVEIAPPDTIAESALDGSAEGEHLPSAVGAAERGGTPSVLGSELVRSTTSGMAPDSIRPEIGLDESPDAEIRRVLEEAIQRARLTRELRVQPAIIETVVRDGKVRVVFEIDAGSTPNGLESRLAVAHPRASIDELRVFPLLSHGAARLDATALLALIESGASPSIELDGIYRPSLLQTIPLIGADLAHDLDFDGDGMVVAVLDSGVDRTHPFFADRIVEEACFSVLGKCPNDSSQMFGTGSAAPCPHPKCSHGTHVAGIAVGRDPNGELVGVAPNAGLIAIQIFSELDDDIGAYSSDILAAFQHLLGLAPFYRIASVNLSVGGDPFASEAECDQASASQLAAVALLRAAGMTTVAASGNEHLTNAISSPACLSNVMGVGSSTAADRVSGFTNSAAFLSVLSPGQSVESAGLGGGTRFATGTSMAAPHVAGAVAVFREAYPAATVGEIENAIRLSGLPVLDERNGETIPRIEIQKTIELLMAAAPPAPDPEVVAVDEETGDPTSAVASTSSGGGGAACGLIGIEPFLVLGLIRLDRRRTRAWGLR